MSLHRARGAGVKDVSTKDRQHIDRVMVQRRYRIDPYWNGDFQCVCACTKIFDLRQLAFDQRKLFAGVTLNLGFSVTLEADRVGDYRSYSGKVGFRF